MSYEMDDVKKIGIGLTGFGVLFSFLGVIFVFDKGLLAMGNILFLCGLALTIGIKSTVQFFTTPQHYKGTIAFVIGFFVLIVGWTFIGMLLEAYGFFVLFSGFWPTAKAFLYKVPVLGWLLHHPFLAFIFDRFGQRRVAV